MTTFSTSLTKHTVLLPQSHDSSHHVSETKCPTWPTYLLLLQKVDSTDHLVPQKGPGGILLIFSLPMYSRKDQQEYRHLHRSNCRNTLIYVHTFSCTLPICDMSLGSQTIGTPEAGDFAGSFEPYNRQCNVMWCEVISHRLKSWFSKIKFFKTFLI
jgi:hypothetical protein